MNHLSIIGNTITFKEYPIAEVGTYIYCPSFSVDSQSIKTIAIAPRLGLDEERLFIILIDNLNNLYKLPDLVIGESSINELEVMFGLSSITDWWDSFSYEEHRKRLTNIIYPKSRINQELFIKSRYLLPNRLISRGNNFSGKINI